MRRSVMSALSYAESAEILDSVCVGSVLLDSVCVGSALQSSKRPNTLTNTACHAKAGGRMSAFADGALASTSLILRGRCSFAKLVDPKAKPWDDDRVCGSSVRVGRDTCGNIHDGKQRPPTRFGGQGTNHTTIGAARLRCLA
jgi:hypothetical protein